MLGATSSARIGTLVKDVVTETLAGGLTEIRMSEPVLDAVLGLRGFLFDAVYENLIATAEFRKASGILSRAVGEGAGAPRRVSRSGGRSRPRGSTPRPAISSPA